MNHVEGRGRFDAFEELRWLVKLEIGQSGFEPIVEKYLPSLLPSLAAGAFHPLIRLGFAIHAKHDMEVASALAYWLSSGFDPKIKGVSSAGSLKQALSSLEPLDLSGGRFGAGLQRLVELDRYPDAVNTNLEECARTSLDVYLGTRNFFALHFVTGTQAARTCAPYVELSELLPAVTAVQAGYLVVGSPEFDQPLPPRSCWMKNTILSTCMPAPVSITRMVTRDT